MSFLAQLRRNQQVSSPAELQLSYLLQRDTDENTFLSLYLSRLDSGCLQAVGKPYVLQREHLLQPPPFLTREDSKALSLLQQTSDVWLSVHQFGVFPQDVIAFVSLLCSTQKCFIERNKGAWQALSIAGSYPARPIWQMNAEGVQSLTWSTPEGTELWLLNGNPYAYDPEKCQLLNGDYSQVDSSQVELLSRRVAEQIPIEPFALTAFLASAGSEWQNSGLPLPLDPPKLILDAHVSPILVFKDNQVSLSLRYCSDFVCIQREFNDSSESLCAWSGQQLMCMDVQSILEKQILDQLNSYMCFFESDAEGAWFSKSKDHWQALLLEQRSELESKGFIFYFGKSFKHHYIAPKNWAVEIKSAKANHWQLSLAFDAEELNVDVCELLRELRKYNQSNREFHQEVMLGNKILVLSAELIQSLSLELGDLLEFNQIDGPLPLSQIHHLKKLKDHLPEGTQWTGDTSLLDQAIDLHSSPIMLDSKSSGINADLRSYQWLGVCWIQHLKKCGVNGLLADDMGLGKTLQALAHLSLEQKSMAGAQQSLPSLIVAPTSLLSNWAAEITRFCPHLSHVVIHGSQRHAHWPLIDRSNIVITSYPLLVRDIGQWQKQPLNWLILDEAQVIKNVGTKVSQAARSLQSNHRLCLSGTPVENHLGELWSILDFLEPKLLGSHKQFRDYYQKPIEEDANQPRFTQLLSNIEPFILRRTKAQVAKDLPPKTQIKQMVTLGDEQMAFYEKLKMSDWESLSEHIQTNENNGQKQILLLTALMRLRQVCCDPLLLSEDILKGERVASAKTEYCLDMLRELVDEGRSVLVFSQFTSMLDILSERLEEEGIAYLMLTGKSKNRQQLVERFQAGESQVFLISLKAGGVGLNLTRADTVIHFDPWWNQAAEEQASDRAHRIGQNNPVFVYKLIAEGTIEEKIALMQERKSLISQQVNEQAQLSGETFALKLEDLLMLYES